MGNSVSHCEEAALPGPAIEEVEVSIKIYFMAI